MAINVGSLLVNLGLESGEFKSGLNQAEKEFRRSTKRMEAIGKSMQSIGTKLSIAVTAPIIALGVAAIKGAKEQAAAMAQVEAALKSMGNGAGKTAEQLLKASDAMEMRSLFNGDEILRKMTANMLTFGNIAGDVFDRAQQAALDLATRMGGDLQAATIMVGKALNAPADGLAALRRVGIQFTEQQEAQIKAMVEVGNVAGAQSIMLGELERQFGGAAQAAANTEPLRQLQVKLGQIGDTIGEKLLPLLDSFAGAAIKVLDAFGKLSPGMQEAIIITAGLAAAFGPLLIVIGSIVSALAPYVAGIKLATTVVNSAGVATTTWTVTLATLRATLLTLVQTLGPYVLVLGTIGALVAALVIRHRYLTQASETYRKAQAEANKVTERASKVVQDLATAQGEARKAALAAARQEQQNVLQKLRSAQASLQLAKAELLVARARADTINQTAAIGDTSGILFGSDQSAKAETNLRAQTETLKKYTAALREINEALRQPGPVAITPTAVGGTGGTTGGGSSARVEEDRTLEIERRFNSELIGYAQQSLSAMQRVAMSADERAELELRSVEWARIQTLAEIDADEDYNKTQKDRLSQAVENLADLEREGIEFQRRMELEREAADLAQISFDSQREQLALAGDIADTQADRKRIAFEILQLEQEYRRNMLELVLASGTATDAEKQRAQAILDSLSAIEAGERASAGRANETDVDRYLRELNKSPGQINEEMDRIKIDGLERMTDALADAIANWRSLGDAVKGVISGILSDLLRLSIQQAITKPLANALFGGGIKIPGFAKGTSFAPGGLALVGERGPELVNLPRGSQVIPNDDLQRMGGGNNSFTWNVVTPDANSFGRSQRQMENEARRRLGV